MAKFLGVHDMGPGKTEDMVTQSWESYKQSCAKLGLSAEHAHTNAPLGRAYCITDASSAEDVQKAHDDAGVQVNEIIEIKDLA